MVLTATLLFLKPLLDYFMLNYTNAVEPWKVLYHASLKLIEARRSGSVKQSKVVLWTYTWYTYILCALTEQFKDMLQLTIDASDDANDSSETAATSSGCTIHQMSTAAARHKLSAEEIVENSVTFLFADHETTANTLSFATYLLSLNPDIQGKLQSEIDGYFNDKTCESYSFTKMILCHAV